MERNFDAKFPFERGPRSIAVSYPAETIWSPTNPESAFGGEYDVTPDGQRFLINQPSPDAADPPITGIVNGPKLTQK